MNNNTNDNNTEVSVSNDTNAKANSEPIHKTNNKNNNKNIKSINYYKQFNNTEKLPNTEIIKKIENGYSEYLENKNDIKVNLGDIFDFNFEELFENTTSKNSVYIDKKNIQNNESFTLEKLITYLIYTKSSDFLIKDSDSYRLDIQQLKNQVGKDVNRIKIQLNNTLLNFHTGGEPNSSSTTPKTISKEKQKTELKEKVKTPSTPDNSIRNLISGDEKYIASPPVILDDSTKENLNDIEDEDTKDEDTKDEHTKDEHNEKQLTNYEITDKYNKQIISSFDSKKINYDILNQIDILSCQNIFNLISDLLQITLNKILKDKLNNEYIMFSPSTTKDTNDSPTESNEKTMNLTINNETNLMKIEFDTYLFNSSDFISVGRLSFTMNFNFLTNTFLINSLSIQYNLDSIISKKSFIPNDDNSSYNSDSDNSAISNTNYFSQIKDATGNYISSHPNLSKIAIPAGVAGVGLATLFGLGVLGGKTKKAKKTRKTKYSKKFRKTRNQKKLRKTNKSTTKSKISKITRKKIRKQKNKKTRKI